MGTNEVAVVESKLPSLAEMDFTREDNAFGTDDVSAGDIRICRVLLAQKMSPITDNKAAGIKAGDMWDSITEERMVEEGKPFSFIPIHIFKTLTLKKMVNGKYEFLSSHAWDPAFANAPYEYEQGGEKFQNITNINVLAIKESDLGNEAALPVTVTFRSSSLNCGKDIIADCLQAKAKGASSAQLTITVVAELKTNDKGAFYVYKKKASRMTKDYSSNKHIFKNWYDLFNSGKAKVDSEETLDTDSSNGSTEFRGQF